MEVRVLGPLEVVSADGARRAVRGPRRRLLLATLVLHRNAVIGIEQLIDVLFGDDPPARAAGTVQSYVSRLRHDLGDGGGRLQTRSGGYTLLLGDDDLDSARFERQVAQALTAVDTDAGDATQLLTEALRWWGGDRAYAEFSDDLNLQAESTRLEEVRQRAVEGLVQARIVQADFAGAIDVLESSIARWPLRERLRAQQMVALHRWGRQPEALRAFQRFGDELAEYGLVPSPSLVDLQGRILRQDPSVVGPPATRESTRAPASTEPPRGNLPLSVTALLGRDVELSELARLLKTFRLSTLTGPGGVGKTRLAIRLAERAAPEHPDGVWVCDLAGIREDSLAVEAVATSLEVQRRPGRSVLEGLVEVLKHRRILVVFDNCEHLLGPVAEITESILRSCPGVRIITTSREPLNIDGEEVWPLGPLAPPAPGETDPVVAMESPAVRLFVARATSAQPAFRLTGETTAAVSDICRRLDGLPLALELAAARVRSMAAGDLADRLQEGLGVLEGGSRRDPRHQTLHATVAWSYDLLGHAEQALFDRLSIFAGTFTVDDVRQICADRTVAAEAVPNLLSALVDKSMVVADTRRSPSRYSLLETLRTFGREQLRDAGTAALTRRHALWGIERAWQAPSGLDGPDEARWARHLEDQFDDLRIAHRWAMAHGDVDGALHLVVGLREFAFRRMRYELFSWVEATLEMPGVAAHPLAPLAYATAAYGCFVRGDLDHATALAERSLTVEQQLALSPCGLHWRTLGNVAYYRGHADMAAGICERMVDAARASGHDARLVHALYMTSVGLASIGRADDSRRLADEAVIIARRTMNPTSVASALFAQALTLERTDPAGAASLLDQAVSHGTAANNRWIVAFARTELISLAARGADLDRALTIARDVIDTWYGAGDWANQWLTLRHVATVLAQRGDSAYAAVLHAAVTSASADTAMPIEASDLRRVAAILDHLPVDLGPARFADAQTKGATMAANDVVRATQDVIDRLLATR